MRKGKKKVEKGRKKDRRNKIRKIITEKKQKIAKNKNMKKKTHKRNRRKLLKTRVNPDMGWVHFL